MSEIIQKVGSKQIGGKVQDLRVSQLVDNLAGNGEYELSQAIPLLATKLQGNKISLLHFPPGRVESVGARTRTGGVIPRILDGRGDKFDLALGMLSVTSIGQFAKMSRDFDMREVQSKALREWYTQEFKSIEARVKNGETFSRVLSEYPQLQLLLYGKIESLPGTDFDSNPRKEEILKRYDSVLGYLRFRGESKSVPVS